MDNRKIKLKRLITLREAQEILARKYNICISKPAVIQWVKDISTQPAGKGGRIFVWFEDFITKMDGGYNGKNDRRNDTNKNGIKTNSEKKPESSKTN